MSTKETPPEAMLPDELRDALEKAGFGQSEFARLIGRTPSAVRNYLQGIRPVTGEMALLLRLLARHPELKAEAINLAGLTPEDIKPPVGAAARKRRQLGEDTAPDESRPVPMSERWANDDWAGVRVMRPEGAEVILGADKGVAEAAKSAKASPEAAGSDEVAKRMAAIMKSLNRHGKGKR